MLKSPALGIPTLAHLRYHWPRPGWPHVHEGLQVLLILSGKTDIICQGQPQPHPLKADDICIIPPGLTHQVETRGQKGMVELIDLHINLAHDGELAQAWRGVSAWRIMPGQAAIHAQVADLLAHTADAAPAARDPMLASIAWLILGLASGRSATPQQHHVDRRLLSAERFIADHLKDRIGTPDIAAACGLSVSQLNRVYRQHRQTTPAQRVMDMRLALARELLPANPLTLKQIARECGFVCVNHFSRVFRQHVGMTPGEYRSHAMTTQHQEP